jgi:hypothetical protein
MSKEQDQSWIPIRDKNTSNGSGQKYGQVTWEDLAYGSHLEINVDHLNSLLQKMDISYPIHLRSIASSRRNKNEPTRLPNHDGTTSASAINFSSEKKSTNSKFIFDTEFQKFLLLFDTTQMAEEVENSLSDGLKNPEFYDKYAQKLNSDLKNTLFKIKFYDLMEKAGSDPQLAQEVFGAYLSFFLDVLVSIIFSIKFLSDAAHQKLTPESVMNDLLMLYASFTAYYICFQNMYAVIKSQPKGDFENKLLDGLKAMGDFMRTYDIRSYFFPYKLAEQLLPALAENLMYKETLIRARKNCS